MKALSSGAVFNKSILMSSDPVSILHAPLTSVSIGSGHISATECTLKIRCRDRYFRDTEVCDVDGHKLFVLEAKGPFMSWSIRRTLKDSSGNHILDLRHYKSKLKQWIVEDPTGRELCLVKDGVVPGSRFTAVDAQVSVEVNNVTISLRSFDHAGTKTHFEVDGVVIAEMLLTDNNDVSFLHRQDLERTSWRLRIAGGVDLPLVLALAFCRAEISHAWRR